jgi:hypothetical protein
LASLPEYRFQKKFANDNKDKNVSEEGGEGEQKEPTNPGTLLHPHGCKPCAFFCRQRCQNGDACDFCHHSSHPRTRGKRRRKREQVAEADDEKEPSSRASLCSTATIDLHDDLSSHMLHSGGTSPSWSLSAQFVHPFPRGRSMAPP